MRLKSLLKRKSLRAVKKGLASLLAFACFFSSFQAHSSAFAADNQSPSLAFISDAIVSTDLEGPVEIQLSATDPEGDALTYSANGLPPGATLDENGLFTWTPEDANVGDYEITFTVSDGINPPVSQTIFLMVIPGNQSAPQEEESEDAFFDPNADISVAENSPMITLHHGGNTTPPAGESSFLGSPSLPANLTGNEGSSNAGGGGFSGGGGGLVTGGAFASNNSSTGTGTGSGSGSGSSGGGGGGTTTPSSFPFRFTDLDAVNNTQVFTSPHVFTSSEGIAPGDLNGDDLVDFVVTRNSQAPLLFVNDGDGTFTGVIPGGFAGALTGGIPALADIDNDGDLDVFIARNNGNFLFENNGSASFTDITAAAGLTSGAISVGATFSDYDNDRFVDLLVVHQNQSSQLFRNLGNKTFQDQSAAANFVFPANTETRAAAFFDVNNDGHPDIYTANYRTANILFINQGNGTFLAVSNSNLENSGRSVGIALGDINRDNFTDLLLLNEVIAAGDDGAHLFQNNFSVDGTFTDITTQAGIPALGANPRDALFADFDNDGALDIYIIRNSESNILLANNGSGKFTDKTTAASAGDPLVARQTAAADLNSDGKVDILTAGNPTTVLQNNSDSTNKYFQIKTIGTRSNKDGLGAMLEVVAGSLRQTLFMQTGISKSKNSPFQTIGLAGNNSASSVIIHWPSGTVQNVTSKITSTQLNIITENAAPQLTVTGPTTLNEGGSITLAVTATDPDGDEILLSLTNQLPNSSLTPVNPATPNDGQGTFVFTPDFSQAGIYSLNFVAADKRDPSLIDTETIVVVVNNIVPNQSPTISPALQDFTIDEGQNVSFDVIASDPNNDPLTFSISAPVPLPANVTFVQDAVNPNIYHFTFTPDFTQNGSYDFNFLVSDGVLSTTGRSMITVRNKNRAPLLAAIGNQAVNEGQTLNFVISANDADGDTLTYSATGLPANSTFTPGTQTFDFTPGFTQEGFYDITFQVSDGTLIDSETIRVTVNDAAIPGPDVPVLIDPGLASFSGNFNLQWSDEAASGAVEYVLEESDKEDFSNITNTYNINTFSKAMSLTQTGAYFYRVAAKDAAGNTSPYSNIVNICVLLERELDILNTYLNQGVIDGNPGASQNQRLNITDPDGLGILPAGGNALQFNYDLAHQSLAGLFFVNLTGPVNIANYKTLNFRVRGDLAAGSPVKLTVEMRKGGEFASLVLFFNFTGDYQDLSFPFYARMNEVETVTVLVHGDTVGGDNFGTVFVDELFLSSKEYLPDVKPDITANSGPARSDEEILDFTEAQAAHFFYEQFVGPGHVLDDSNKDFSSIAATGFGLTALTVLAERHDTGNPNWDNVTPAQAATRTEDILDDILRIQSLQGIDPGRYGTQGFLYHFIEADGSRKAFSEVSSIDQAILMLGVLTAGEYFGGSIQAKAQQVFDNTNWSLFLNANDRFIRQWTPENGLAGEYDHYTDEILILSLITIASDPNNLDFLQSWYSFPRDTGTYQSPSGQSFTYVNSFFGSYFTYLYAHEWFNFKKYGNDKPSLVPGAANPTSVNWWNNSVQAARAARQFAIDRSKYFPFSYGQNSWGISAVQRPDGEYEGLYGTPPYQQGTDDGTIAVYAPLSSMSFLQTFAGEPLSDNQGFKTLKNYYNNFYNQLFGPYGPYESFDNKGDFSQTYLGIDVGSEVLMIENYRTGFIWDTLEQHPGIQAAVEKIFGSLTGGTGGFDAVLKNVSNNAPASSFNFGTLAPGSGFSSAGQYIELEYTLSGSAAICIFTNNRNYTGQGEGAGLVGTIDTAENVPLFWTASDNLVGGGYGFSGDASVESEMQDVRRADFLSLENTRKRAVIDSNNILMPDKLGAPVGSTPVYIYLAGFFTFASGQPYEGAVVVEVSQLS